jgi:plasmid maintenance system killer protein
MFEIRQILEERDVYRYLVKRGLLYQYKKAKGLLLLGNLKQVGFKKRKPKSDGIYYFRINRQYRAVGCFRPGGVFVVAVIDDHS